MWSSTDKSIKEKWVSIHSTMQWGLLFSWGHVVQFRSSNKRPFHLQKPFTVMGTMLRTRQVQGDTCVKHCAHCALILLGVMCLLRCFLVVCELYCKSMSRLCLAEVNKSFVWYNNVVFNEGFNEVITNNSKGCITTFREAMEWQENMVLS